MLAPRYTRWQREAVASVFASTDMTAGEVAQLAANGGLEHPNGARLNPFFVPQSTVRSMTRRARARAATADGVLRLADMEPHDAVERMRRQIAEVIETELDRIDLLHDEGRSVSGETLRQLARAAREFSSIPGLREPRPPAPGAKVNGVRDGSETRGGLAGKVLMASRP